MIRLLKAVLFWRSKVNNEQKKEHPPIQYEEEEKVFQEFYCGECQHYIRVRLNMSYNRTIWLVCPMCGHKHQRYIDKGTIYERGRYEHGDPVEDICPPKSACSKEPFTKKMRDSYSRRDGAVIRTDADLARASVMIDRWAEVAARERGE